MSADPAELIFFHEMTPQKFFEEAERLGHSVAELQDPETRAGVFCSCLINLRAQTAKRVAADLNLTLTDEQAEAIARNSLVPDVLADPAPLTAEERTIAAELYYHAIRTAAARHGGSMSDAAARAAAKKMLRTGERGLSVFHKLVRGTGCLVVLATLGLGASLALLGLWLLLPMAAG